MLKRKVLSTIAVLAIYACLPRSATATPSTLIWIPSTDIQQAGATRFGLDFYAPAAGSALVDAGLTAGTGTVEYGVDYLIQNGLSGEHVRFNAKARIFDETGSSPRVVGGVFDLGSGASNQVYILGSKTFGIGRFHLGCSIGNRDVLGGDNAMLLAGFDRPLSDRWWLGIDYQSGRSAFGGFNVGVSCSLSPGTSYLIGYGCFNNPDTAGFPNAITGQLDMDF